MKITDAYEDLSAAQQFELKFNKSKACKNFCYKSFGLKVADKAAYSGPWGGDDIMHWFEDESMLLQRRIVREFQLFKA